MQKSLDPVAAKLPRVRGRPRAFDRTAALATAMRLFWERGYEATSTAELAKAMEIGVQSLYAAFGSKASLYGEAIEYYQKTNDHLVWAGFDAADTARDAVAALLSDSAAVLSGSVVDIPNGCMVTLSAVGSEGHSALGEIVRLARAGTLERIERRLQRAVEQRELSSAADVRAIARFVQSVQYGMSILARDRVPHEELERLAQVAITSWDAWVAPKHPDNHG